MQFLFKISITFSTEKEKNPKNFYGTTKTPNGKANLKKNNKARTLTPEDFKTITKL